MQRFLATEAAGGILLLAAAIAALVWANSPWRDAYESLWRTELTLSVGAWAISEDLRHWVNDLLMAVFFFVVGLEIKRELVAGDLRDPRVAALPAVAALGGMVVPAAIYAALNAGGDGSAGWGIPMATDIAFAVGVLALLGRRAPPSLKLFLLTLAIADDVGAIVVIAIFYSGGVAWPAIGAAAAIAAAIVAMQRAHVRAVAAYGVLAAALWLAVFQSGVHATIAGVALGLLTPAVRFHPPAAVSREAQRIADETTDDPDPPDADADAWLELATLSREAVSPLARLEHVLHPWSSYVIVPLFALANAGVALDAGTLRDAATSPIALGVALGLVIGKTIGITLFSWLAVRLGLGRLPSDASWRHLTGVAAVAGIGFTVSLFVAGLAFPAVAALDAAKVGILAGSLVAGALGASLISFASARSVRDEPKASA